MRKNHDLNISYIGSQRPKLSIGNHTYINGMRIFCWDNRFEFQIGKYCSIADDVTIIAGGEHDKNWVSTYPFIDRWNLIDFEYLKKSRYKGNITIENDIWIAHGVTILSGVTIGNGAVIGANSLVTKNVPPYSIVGGNPAKIIKFRFNEEIVKDLLLLKWWDWDKSIIIKSQELFTKPEEFIKEYKKLKYHLQQQ